MKKKNKKPYLNMDERNKMIAYKVISIMYFITIIAMQAIVIYRQFALGQDYNDFEDIAILLTVNSLFLISALLYFGAIPIQKLSVKSILILFVAFVFLGSLFTYAKYNIFSEPALNTEQLLNKLLIITSIIGIIMGVWILLTLLDKKRLDKELE